MRAETHTTWAHNVRTDQSGLTPPAPRTLIHRSSPHVTSISAPWGVLKCVAPTTGPECARSVLAAIPLTKSHTAGACAASKRQA